MVMRTPEEVSYALSAGRERFHFNTLGESGRVAGGRGRLFGDRIGSVSSERMGRFCSDRMGSISCDRMGSVSGDRMGSVFCDHMGSVSGDRVGRLICYTEMRSTR
jgi:hypothetical protein